MLFVIYNIYHVVVVNTFYHVVCVFIKLQEPSFRVGSHVVSVRIHCTEKWRTSFHTDVLSKS